MGVVHFVLLFIALLYSSCYADNPGFKSLTSLGAIQRVKDILVPIVQPYVQGMTIPDVSGHADTPIDVTISYDITNIVIQSFSFGGSSVALLPGQGVQVQLSGSTCTATMDWDYSASFISGSGSATDNLQMNFNIILQIGDNNGKPSITVSSLSVSITSIDITVHGGASWFYQVMVDIFKSKIQGIMENSIQSQLASVINQLANFYLRKTPTTYPINKNVVIDYSLTSGPAEQSNFAESDHKGAFMWTTPQLNCQFNPSPLPDDVSTSPLTFVISEAMGDCVGWLLYERDLLSGYITPDMVPDNSPFQLNTSSPNMKRVLPQLYQLYPDCGMTVKVWTNAAPDVRVNASTQLVDVVILGSAEVFVINASNSQMISAFMMDIDILLHATVGFSGGNVTANLKSIAHNNTLDYTWIGNINMVAVDELVSFFLGFAVQPQINNIINAGIPIPRIEGVEFMNSNVQYGNGYLKVGSDFTYHPQNSAEFVPRPNDILTPNVIVVN